MTDYVRGAVPLPPDPEVWAKRRADLLAAKAPEPPAEPEPPAPPPGPAPCEVCGVTVTAAYIASTGRARHGHHPAQEP